MGKSPNKIASTKQEMNARMKDKPSAEMFLSKNAKMFISPFPNKSKKQFAMAMKIHLVTKLTKKIHLVTELTKEIHLVLLIMKFSMSKEIKQTVQIKFPKS